MKLKAFKEKDKKKMGIILFTILCILLIVGVILFRTFAIFEVNQNLNIMNGNIGSLGDVRFYFYLDDELVKDVPTKAENIVFDSYHSYCENGTNISWNDHSWQIDLKNLEESPTKCYLKFIHGYKESTLNGAIPDLGNGLLTPVTIDENGAVKKADLTNSWYNYANKTWANSVLLKENSYELLNANGKISGGAIKEEEFVRLDGKDDYIDLGYANYELGNQMTLAIQVKINAFTDRDHLLGNWEGAGGGIYVENQKFVFNGVVVDDSTNYEGQIISEITVDPNLYYTVIAIYNGEKTSLYINGEKQTQEGSVTGNIKKSVAPFVIGANPPNTGDPYIAFSNIDVKQAAIFNRAIDESEVKEISNHFKITNSEKLLNYIDFTNKTYESNEVIPEDNIESYFVWIPRYKYQIFSNNSDSYYGVESELGSIDSNAVVPEVGKSTPIQIVFETNDVNKSNGYVKDSWLTHPAFTSFDSNGMWVGKFETGYLGAANTAGAQQNSQDFTKVIIKPNVYSWRNINVSNAFYTSYKYQRDLESHMMKNMEWGAVAYLTNSQYGRCDGTSCEEVRTNNNGNYITGYSAKEAPTCGYTASTESCNARDYTGLYVNGQNGFYYGDPNSRISSTTGNYSGIYDMAGGSWEYVMGVMMGQDGKPASGYNDQNNSNFVGALTYTNGGTDPNKKTWTKEDNGLDWPDKKYYDLYSYSNDAKNYQRGNLGDATKELGPFYSLNYKKGDGTEAGNWKISSWYTDAAQIVTIYCPFFVRSGGVGHGSNNGVFNFHCVYGNANMDRSFRVILTP